MKSKDKPKYEGNLNEACPFLNIYLRLQQLAMIEEISMIFYHVISDRPKKAGQR